jgi:hypothetical protein
MVHREVPSVRPSLAVFALITVSLVSFGSLGLAGGRRSHRKPPRIELQLTGPATVKPGESLAAQQFKALLTNRSAGPQVFIVRDGYLMNADWDWTVTDSSGSPIGMELVEHGFCGTPPYSAESLEAASWLHDSDLFVLAPGESHVFPIPGGPSDDYYFPSAGTYHLAVTLTYVPPNAPKYLDQYGESRNATGYSAWKLGDLSVRSLEALQNSLPAQIRSHTWNLMLSSARRPAGGTGPPAFMIR